MHEVQGEKGEKEEEEVPDGPDGGVAAAVVPDHVRVTAVVDQGEGAVGSRANLVPGEAGP